MSPASEGDPLVAETRADLSALARTSHAHQVRSIHLMGLEREQIVAIAYREDAMGARLRELPVDEETRAVIGHALRWIWKEEQMHATFVRGVLLQMGGRLLAAQAFVQQAAGAVAGWSTSVLHHVRFGQAPFSRSLAHVLTFFGWLAGKVPRAVTRSLRHLSFREYCRFSIAAEATAALCWHRVADLFAGTDASAAPRRTFYARMGSDEDHHGQIFSLFLEALNDDGTLAPGWDAATMRARLAAISPFYVERSRRPDAADQPLGTGGAVHVVCDRPCCRSAPIDAPEAALERLLDALDLKALLRERAERPGKPITALKVAIKPTFMRLYARGDRSPCTDPALVRALANALRAHGIEDVAVLESALIYDWFYEQRDVASVARYGGFTDPSYRVIDVERDRVPHAFARGMSAEEVCATWRDADVRIGFGKLSTHPVDQVYLGVSQLESLVPRTDESVFLDRRIHRGAATMALLSELPPHLSIVDGYRDVADGLGGVLGSRRPIQPRRLYGGRDAIAVDQVICRHVGERDPRVSAHLSEAMHWFDDPAARTEVRGCDRPITELRIACHDEKSALLSLLAHPMYVLASGRGALFLPEMDEAAFPPKVRFGWPTRIAQRAMRWLLDLRLPSVRDAAR